ncbi:Alkaline phosphatase, partial [hydrothermal vent metagenome]
FGGLQGYLAGSNFLKDNGLNLADIQFEINQGDLVISDGVEQLPTGAASVTGWNTAFSAEARWAAVAGPDGETITAMETGQANTGKSGGGALATNTFEIDETQTYEYTVYVRRHDLTKSHRLYLGAAGGTVVDAVTGAQNTNPYFYYTISGPSGKPLQDDRWYKIVGYILPEGDRLTSHADKGGVYDTVTGEKIASVTNFAWDPNKTRSTAYMRYFSYYGATDQGYSTYWHQPSVRVVTENSAGTNLLDLAGWPADLHNTNVITDFAATMGYAAPVTTSVSRTGTIYSDVIFASGSGNINIYDNSSSTVANGPSMSGLSRLSDDIFVGNSGNNNIYGYAGWDWLEGGDGVDRLYGGEGDDFLSGGDGNDYVAHATLTGNVPGGLFGGNGNDTLVGGAGSDAVYGENGDDILLVDQDYNWDYLHGGAGSDTVSFENFDTAVTVDMGDNGGNNAYTAIQYRDGWVSIENLTGSKYSDTLQGNNSANVLTGLSGDDTINGHGGNDTIIGGAGADTINGGSGTDTVSYRKSNRGVQVSLKDGTARGGDAQGDQISAIENIEGSDQSDVLQGGTASGQLQGLGGSDIFLGSPGATQFLGGEGIDTVDYSSSTAGVNVRLDIGTGAAGYASGDSYISIEQVIGSAFNDVLYGTSESDRLQGGAGNDYLYGQLGDDSYAFTAGSGLDRIT